MTALAKMHEAGAEAVLISRAERPALALLDGDVLRVESPKPEVTDPSGAGDSMTAGIAAALAEVTTYARLSASVPQRRPST